MRVSSPEAHPHVTAEGCSLWGLEALVKVPGVLEDDGSWRPVLWSSCILCDLCGCEGSCPWFLFQVMGGQLCSVVEMVA